MDGRKRIAIYGGTFDPVHHGHLQVARKTVELFGITKLLFLPARQAPHKLERQVTAALHRYAMLSLATQPDPNLFVSTFELDAPDRRYTIDTLAYFRSQLAPHDELFFVMGADSWAEITTWREWQRLLQVANHIVVTRPGYVLDQALTASVARIEDVRGGDAESIARVSRAGTGTRVYFTDAAMVDVSASTIREAARAGNVGNLELLVPAVVAEYITKYRLYKNSHEI
jgi:nicotinate-nucleotide adenylyltransferase